MAVDNEPSEVDVKVDAALGDLVRCAYHDRWLRAGLDATSHIAGDHDTINSADLKLRSIIDRISKEEYIPK